MILNSTIPRIMYLFILLFHLLTYFFAKTKPRALLFCFSVKNQQNPDEKIYENAKIKQEQ